MRIVHVDSARTWRGGQNQVLLTSRGMAARGHEVWLACQDGGPLEIAGARRPESWPCVPWASTATSRRARWWAWPASCARSQPDVVHLHDPHAVSAGVAASSLAPGFRRIASRRVDFPLRGVLSRWKYGACRRVIAVSRAIAGSSKRTACPRTASASSTRACPTAPPAPTGGAALEALGVPRDAPVVGNVAALTGHKDHATLLEAAALVREPPARRCGS